MPYDKRDKRVARPRWWAWVSLWAAGFILLSWGCVSGNGHQAVDHWNDRAYAFHYRNLDSTRLCAERALAQAGHDADGYAEALNHLAFVDIAKMDYDTAHKRLDEVLSTTDNQIERLVALVQSMRLCQRRSENKDFYGYREQAAACLRRIAEEPTALSPRQRARLVYAKSEYDIVAAAYFYYVGRNKEFVAALDSIDAHGELMADTAQMLGYLYNMGAGGAIVGDSRENVAIREFDYLLQCYTLAHQQGYVYWEANALQALAEHLNDEHDRRMLIDEYQPAIRRINTDQMAEELLAGNLAWRAVSLFANYGDVYQTAGAYRTLAECYWAIADYPSALSCLDMALKKNRAIEQAPDLVASIREQLSLTYSAMDMKPQSDYNRNVYLDMQEVTRQDRQLEARAEQLDRSVGQLNAMILILGVVCATLALLALIAYLRKRRDDGTTASIAELAAPLEDWKKAEVERRGQQTELIEELQEQIGMAELHIAENKRRNLEQRAKMSLVNSVPPFINRLLHEVNRLSEANEPADVRAERYEYAEELADEINQYNDVLSKWIQMRQGEVYLHIESFPVQPLFDIVAKSKMAFQQKGVELRIVPTDATVKADRTLTLFMVNTIADNARKFTGQGGTVTLSCASTDNYVEISISDTGVGMSEEQLLHVFDHKIIQDRGGANGRSSESHPSLLEDGRVATDEGEANGSGETSHGFGLMNCKGIIEKYKKMSRIFSVCSIDAQSRKGEGSTFSFRLPKGIVKFLMPFLFFLPAHSQHTSSPSPLLRAEQFADSAYFSNINGTYERTLAFADSCISYLNQFYTNQQPRGKATMTLTEGQGTPAELQWFHNALPTNYPVILDIRNEVAVAALALHQWNLYQYNNKAYTQLFRETSADDTLGDYVRTMQRSETNKNVAIALLVLLLAMLPVAYYLLYGRHRLSYRLKAERVRSINAVLLGSSSERKKLEQIEHLWHQQPATELGNPKEKALQALVGQMEDALRQCIADQSASQDGIEQAQNQLNKLTYENARLHVSNSVLDNCLSTLKHETMYYPARIRQLLAGKDQNLPTIQETLCFYKDIYAILSAQAMRQIDTEVLPDKPMFDDLLSILRRVAGQKEGNVTTTEHGNGYVTIDLHFEGFLLTPAEREALFTAKTPHIDCLLCRQIIREIGEQGHARGCGIQALPDERQGTIIRMTLSKAIWKSLK